MTASEFKSNLKKLKGGYLFCGEEDYLKRYYLAAARKETVEENDVFNHIIINSENYSPSFLFSAIQSLPVMADKKFIEIHSLFYSSMSESELEELCSVVSCLSEYEYNILAVVTEPDELDMGTKKQPSKEFAALSKVLTPVIFDRESPARLIDWAYKHFVKDLIMAGRDELALLVDKCGCDMYSLSNEINKLVCYLKENGRDRLTLDDIKNVCTEKKEIEAFDFANAILDGSSDRAFGVLSEMKKRKERPEIILSGISRVIGDLLVVKTLLGEGKSQADIEKKLKMHSYKLGLYTRSASKTDIEQLRKINNICYETDLLIKSSQLNSYTLLERLTLQALKRNGINEI